MIYIIGTLIAKKRIYIEQMKGSDNYNVDQMHAIVYLSQKKKRAHSARTLQISNN